MRRCSSWIWALTTSAWAASPPRSCLRRDVDELFGLLQRGLRIRKLALRHQDRIVVLDDRGHEAAGGNFGAGARGSFGGDRSPIVGELRRRIEVAMDDQLMVVNVGAVIGDEDAGGRYRSAAYRRTG